MVRYTDSWVGILSVSAFNAEIERMDSGPVTMYVMARKFALELPPQGDVPL